MAGKGDRPRPVNFKKYEKNYKELFGIREVSWDTECPKCGRTIKYRSESARDFSIDKPCKECLGLV